MSDYIITMKRSPHINDAERRRRLYEAYTLLLSVSERAKAIRQRDLADSSKPLVTVLTHLNN